MVTSYCCCCFSHSAHWLPTRKKLLYTVANPALGLLNRGEKKEEPPPPPRALLVRREKKKKKVGVTQVVSVPKGRNTKHRLILCALCQDGASQDPVLSSGESPRLKPTQEGLCIVAIAIRGLQVERHFLTLVQLTGVPPPRAPQPCDFCGDVRAFTFGHTTTSNIGHPPSVEGLFRNLYGRETDRDLRSAYI